MSFFTSKPKPTSPAAHTPAENSVLREPATVAACRADYEAGTADRAACDKNWRHK